MSDPFDDSNDQAIDLSAFDDGYARAEVRGPEGVRDEIPDGNYEVRIEEARLSRTPRTNNPMIVWRLRVLGPTHEGASLVKTRVITHRTLAFVKEDLELLGIRLERISDLERHLGGSVGSCVRIFKKQGNNGWTDVYFSRPNARGAAANGGAPLDEFDQPAYAGIDDNLPF